MVSIEVNEEMKKSGTEYRNKLLGYFYELWSRLPCDITTVKFETVIEEFVYKNIIHENMDTNVTLWKTIIQGLIDDQYIVLKDEGYNITKSGREHYEILRENQTTKKEIFHTKIIAIVGIIIAIVAIILPYIIPQSN